jgi:hypothetical protein
MSGKMAETRFTIQFSRTDPTHLQVADILNRQGRRSKAQYLVNAVLHFENCSRNPKIQRTSELDIKAIEAIVNRILLNREANGTDKAVDATPIVQSKRTQPLAEEINFDDALEVLGSDGFNAISDALDMFRKK